MTYLSMVRTDQCQIPQILEQIYQQIESEEPQKNEKQLVSKWQPYFNLCNQFLYGQIDFAQAQQALKNQSNSCSLGVCAKTLSYGDVAWKCETCEKDTTSIICQSCFENGDHKGHKVWLKRNVGGCCDCGDPDALAESGFCSNHKGYAASSEVLLDQLPTFIKKSAPKVFGHLCKVLKGICLKIQQQRYLIDKSGTKLVDEMEKIKMYAQIQKQIFEFFNKSIDITAAFIHYLTDSLSQSFIQQSKINPLSHKCCARTFVDQQNRKDFTNSLQSYIQDNAGENQIIDQTDQLFEKLEDKYNVDLSTEDINQIKLIHTSLCTCSVIDLTMQVNHMIEEKERGQIYEFYVKCFQSFKFKQILGLSFAANLKTIIIDRDYEQKGEYIGNIGVQILTIDEISLMIMRESSLRQNFIDTFSHVVQELIDSKFDAKERYMMYQILYDLKYMIKEKTIKHIINETDFLECLLEQVSRLYYHDVHKLRVEHVSFEWVNFFDEIYEIDIQLTKIFKGMLQEIDPLNVQRNKKIISVFLTFFREINNKMDQVYAIKNGQKGFFSIPLHRLFAFYLARLLQINHIDERSPMYGKKYNEIFRKHLDSNLTNEDVQREVIQVILRPLCVSWVFIQEILAGKWVLSGIIIQKLPQYLYKIYAYYLMLIFSLFQSLISVSPDPSRTIQSIIDVFCYDAHMATFHSALIREENVDEAYSHLKKQNSSDLWFKNVDVKKLRQMIHNQLKFFIQLTLVESSSLYCLMSNLKSKEGINTQCPALNEKIEKLTQGDMRREIVHILIKLKGGADMQKIKEQAEEIYNNEESFDQRVVEVSTTQRDHHGKVNFRLKEEYLKWFDPYFFLIPKDQSKVLESASHLFKDKNLLNELLGDYEGKYQYQSPLNQVIKEAIASSTLINYLKEIVIQYAERRVQKTEKIIDEQIIHDTLRLLLVIGQGAQTLNQNQKNFICQVFNSGKDLIHALISVSEDLGKNGKEVINIILKEFHDIDPNQMKAIANQIGLDNSIQSQQNESKTSAIDEASRKAQIREAALKKKQAIMKKFEEKRSEYVHKNITENHQHQLLSQRSSFTKQKDLDQEVEEEIECSLCKEVLQRDDFYSKPFGQFAYISKSKLLYYSLKQTVESIDQNLQQMKNSAMQHSGIQNEEEEKKSNEEVKEEDVKYRDIQRLIDAQYLDQQTGTGGFFSKCSHFMHYKCLNEYLTTQEKDQKRFEIKKLIGLDFDNFQCPLCKHVANVLFPCDTLKNYQDQKFYQEDFDQYNLILFFTNMLSKLVQVQTNRKQDILPVDVRKEPSVLIKGVCKFVEHRIHEIDLKGIYDFITPHHFRSGWEHYSDIIYQCRNIAQIVLEGGVKIGGASANSDEEMSQETLEQVCAGLFNDIQSEIQSVKFLEKDMSSLAIRLILYSAGILYANDYEKQNQSMQDIIKNTFNLLKIQVVIKMFYLKNYGRVKGSQSELHQRLTDPQYLYQISQDAQLSDQLIQSQLNFLRKCAAMRMVIQAGWRKENEVGLAKKQFNESFAKKLNHIYDDNEEFIMLTEFLNLDGSLDFVNTINLQNDDSDEVDIQMNQNSEQQYSNELQGVINMLQSKDHIFQSMCRNALRQFNPQIQQTQEPLHQDVVSLLNSQKKIDLEMPINLKLLTSYLKFKFVDLPSDYQSLIYEFYKKKCKGCGRQPKEQAICLLCSEVLCWTSKCCANLPGMKANEGELTFHTRTCEGNIGVFLQVSTAKIILIENDRSCISKNSPYLNKFGESIALNSKRWENYYMDKSSGGLDVYEEYRKLYINHQIPNEIIKERSISEVVFRLRIL